MTNKFLLTILTGLLLCGPLHADQIVLNEGKVVSGTITDEDANEVTIITHPNMVIHIEKTKIKSIHRDRVKKKPGLMGGDSPNSKVMPSPLPTLSPIKNVTVGSNTGIQKKDIANISETVSYTTYFVEGPTVVRPHPATIHFDFSWQGNGGKDGTQSKWDSLTLLSTSSISMPRWDPLLTPEQPVIERWNKFITQVQNHMKSHLEIYSETVKEMAVGLSALRASDDAALKKKTNKLVDEYIDRAEKKQRGLDRRETSSLTTPKKKN